MRVENEVVALMAFGAIAIGVGAWGVLRSDEQAADKPAAFAAADAQLVIGNCVDANIVCRHQLEQCAADRERLLIDLAGSATECAK